MSVADRITRASACEVINLTEDEKNIYKGAGWKIARFENDRMVDLFNPAIVTYSESVDTMVEEAVKRASEFISHGNGEYWIVMCSSYQLCEPRRITPDDAGAFARLSHVLAEEFAQL